MKRSHAGVALSLLAHAVLAAILATSWPEPRAVATPLIPPPAPVEIIEVEFAPAERSEPAERAAPVVASRGPGATIGSVAAVHHASIATQPIPSEAHAEPVRSAPPSLPSVRASADGLVEPIAPTPPGETGQFATASHSTFDVHVSADGNVRITDRPNVQGGGLDRIVQREVRRDEAWLEEHHEQSNPIEMKMPRVGATVATFDVGDAAMRLAGQDPYAAAKLKALDATRDARVEVGARHRDLELVRIPQLVRASLDEIQRLPAARRKTALVELWRDCDDSKAGEVARATIKAYVAAAPGFTDDERAALSPR